MTDRTLLTHGLLAAFATGAAGFALWKPTAGGDEKTVTVFAAETSALSGVDWHEDAWDVSLRRAGTDRFTIEVTQRTKTPSPKAASPSPTPPAEGGAKGETLNADAAVDGKAPPASAAAAPSPDGKVAPTAVTKRYPASDRAKDLFASLAPLKAARTLGAVDAEKQKSLGLSEPQSSLVLHVGDKEQRIVIGNATYGSGDRYARLGEGDVFLLQSQTLGPLRTGAATLVERRALPFGPERIRRASIQAGGRGREVLQRYAEDRDKAFFADPAVPDDKLEQLGNWMDRLLKLRIADVVERAPSGAPRLEVELFNGDGTLGALRLWEPDHEIAMATSSAFPTAVSITRANAESILRDLDAVLGDGR